MRRIDHLSDMAHVVGPGCRVLMHSACAAPPRLSAQLQELALIQGRIDIFDLVTVGAPGYVPGVGAGLFRLTTLVPGRAVRRAMRAGAALVIREPISRAVDLVADGTIGCDVLLLHVSAADDRGMMTLGVSCDIIRAALGRKPVVIAEVSEAVPRTCGETIVTPDDVGFWLEGGGGPVEIPHAAGTGDATDCQIADNVAGLISDGDVIQTGIGTIPDMTLARLAHRARLGVHTGILTEAFQPLIERGVVRDPVVTTMAAGSRPFYRFLHCNQGVRFLPCDQTHSAARLAGIVQLCAINGALEIDLQGRINAETAGGQLVSGPGGQPDFARGATNAPAGKSIIALRATSKDGAVSRILPALAQDSPTTIDTSLVDYVVTEYGVARVRNRSGGALVRELAGLAAPEFRAGLRRDALV